MKIGIVGASASGLYAALLLATRKPDAEIVVFDRMDKAGKKILATGNGHCNLFHVPFSANAFNNPEFVQKLLAKHDEAKLLATLSELNIATQRKGELVYPLSYSASAHLSNLLRSCASKNIALRLSETVQDVKGTTLVTDKGTYSFDHVIFAFGGKSQQNLGSDGSLFPIMSKIGYRVNPLKPSLCPVKSKEVTKSLFGVRHAAMVRLLRGQKTLYEEMGEVLFKKDGLSGIAIMNVSAKAQKGDVIRLDLFPEFGEELAKEIAYSSQQNMEGFLAPFLEKPLAEYVLNRLKISAKTALKPENIAQICDLLHAMDFTIDGFYDFDSSQVSAGGIDVKEVNENLQSIRNPKHSFIGECLDINGLCGGYNLGFALLSALTVAEAL